MRCAQHPRREVNVGQLHHMSFCGHALIPRTYSELVPKAMRLVAIGNEPSPHDDGNVFDPQPDLDAVRGGWRNRPARAAVAAGSLAAAAAVSPSLLADGSETDKAPPREPGHRRRLT